MHPGAFARESAIAQDRTVNAARKIAESLGISSEFSYLRVHGDLNQIQVSALNQRKAVADFLEAVAEELSKPIAKPQEQKTRTGKS
jgi:hypothetical protein